MIKLGLGHLSAIGCFLFLTIGAGMGTLGAIIATAEGQMNPRWLIWIVVLAVSIAWVTVRSIWQRWCSRHTSKPKDTAR